MVSGTAITWTGASLAGSNSILFKITDAAGNDSATTGSQSYELDTLAPTLAITTPISGGYINNAEDEIDLVISGISSGADGQTVTVDVGGTSKTATVATGGAWSVTLTSTEVRALSSGTVNITADIDDAAGNPATQATASYIYDITAPTLTVSNVDISADTGTSDSDFLTKTAAQTITATLSSALAQDDVLYGSVDNGSTWTDITTMVSGTAITWTGASLASSNSILFKITDAAGNDSATTGSQAYVLDTATPAPTVSGSGYTNDATPTLAGTAEAGSTVIVTVGGASYTTTATGGNWTVNAGTDTPTSGSYSAITGATNAITVISTDAAGNVSSTTNANLALDTSAPVISSVSVPAAGTYATGQDLSFIVNIDSDILVDTASGTPRLALTVGSSTVYADYVSGSGTAALTFTYTVQNGNLDTDGITVGTLSLNGGAIADEAGNALDLTLNNPGNTTLVLVDATPPTAFLVTSPQSVQLEAISKTNGHDYAPQVTAVGSNGEYVVTWHGADSYGDNSIFVQKFNADGSITNQTPVQLEAIGYAFGDDNSPQVVAVGSNGEFVVAWQGRDSGNDYSIFVQKFNANGTITSQTPVQLEAIGRTNDHDLAPQVAALGSNGEYVVTWSGVDSTGDYSIFVQKFNANGTITNQTPVQLEAISKTNGSDESPQVAAVGSSGEYVITWTGVDSAGDYSIFVQKFNANGTITNQTPVQLEPIGITNTEDYAP
jgi:hypothetical protein